MSNQDNTKPTSATEKLSSGELQPANKIRPDSGCSSLITGEPKLEQPQHQHQQHSYATTSPIHRRDSPSFEFTDDKDSIDASEGRILLRQTDTGKLLAPWRGRQKSPVEEDTRSVTTTTSDVKSSDDATSIASRLSQIVVEQEEKLMFDQTSDNESDYVLVPGELMGGSTFDKVISTDSDQADRQTDAPDAQIGPRRTNVAPLWSISAYKPLEESSKGRSSGKPGMKLVKSSINLAGQEEPSWPRADPNARRTISPNKDSVPEIHVVGPAGGMAASSAGASGNKPDGSEQGQSTLRRMRAKSVALSRYDNSSTLRRHESGFLPERGDLKSLEQSRSLQQQQQQQLHKLDDFNNSKDSLLENNGLPILNIQRSTWTLSDFDQAFSKASDISETNSPGESRKFPAETCDQQQQAQLQQVTVSSLEGRPRTGSLTPPLLARQLAKNPLLKSNSPRLHRFSLGPNQQPSVGSLASAKNRRFSNDALCQDQRYSQSQSVVSSLSSVDICKSGSRLSPVVIGKRRSSSFLGRNWKLGPSGPGSGCGGGGGDFDSTHQGQEGPACWRSCCSYRTLSKFIPVLDWLPKYDYRKCFLSDLTSGVTVAFMNISLCLTAAIVAQTEMGAGFRCSIINAFVYSILTTSKHSSFGAWSIMSQMLLVSVQRALSDELVLDQINVGSSAGFDPEEYKMWHWNIVIMYTFLIGLVQLVSGLLNLGSILSSFIPEALCSGLIAATAIVMSIGQLANMCGTSNKILWSIERNTTELWADLNNPRVDITDLFSGLFRWLEQIALIVKHYDQINFYCVVISVSSVLLLYLNQVFFQRHLENLIKRKVVLPFEVLLLILYTVLSSVFEFNKNYRVPISGPVTVDFDLPTLPNLRLVRELWFNAVATALFSYTITMIMSRTYANKFNYEVDTNQELIACGAGNLIGGLCNALPATASFSRTAGQVESGGKTQMASLINCVLLILITKIFGEYMGDLPRAVMSACLFFAFIRMMRRFNEVFMYWRICKVDFAIWIVTFCAILTYDLVNGFLYGLMFSVITMLYRAQK